MTKAVRDRDRPLRPFGAPCSSCFCLCSGSISLNEFHDFVGRMGGVPQKHPAIPQLAGSFFRSLIFSPSCDRAPVSVFFLSLSLSLSLSLCVALFSQSFISCTCQVQRLFEQRRQQAARHDFPGFLQMLACRGRKQPPRCHEPGWCGRGSPCTKPFLRPSDACLHRKLRPIHEPLSKLLVSPLVTPIIVPYIFPYIIPLSRSLDYGSHRLT